MIRIVLSVTNDLVADQRIHRIAESLMRREVEVTLVGRLLPNSLPVQRDYHTYRMKLFFNKGPLFYAEYNIRLFFYLFFSKVNILVANDLDTLPANYLISVLHSRKLVYDAHEYFTEVPELTGRPLVKNIWKKIEQIILPRIAYSYTVSNSIAEVYKKLYNIDMKVVRNLPVRSLNSENNTHSLPEIPVSNFVIYQGSLNMGRGLELLIDAFGFINDIKCVIAGDGDIKELLKRRVSEMGLGAKVIFTGKLAPDDLKTVTERASLGVSIEEPVGLNYYYSLPNKLFDYVQAGIPVLVSDFPEMRQITDSYGIGEILRSRQPKDVALQIETMVKKDLRSALKEQLTKAASELCWENEEKELLKVYEMLLR
jgi:glycosyltransferase involved in cell wall biosynthesis